MIIWFLEDQVTMGKDPQEMYQRVQIPMDLQGPQAHLDLEEIIL